MDGILGEALGTFAARRAPLLNDGPRHHLYIAPYQFVRTHNGFERSARARR